MKRVTIVASGAVGHGTSTLVQALANQPALAVEIPATDAALQGIGAAQVVLPNGDMATVIDASGEDPVASLCARLPLADAVLLVIAATDGATPQTLAQVDAIGLAGIQYGVVALTKTGLVDRGRSAEVERALRDLLKDTCLGSAPVVRVDPVAARGMNELRRKLMAASSRCPARSLVAPFRLLVGDVRPGEHGGSSVTGVLLVGTLRPGDAAEIPPASTPLRVGAVWCGDKPVDEAAPGMLITAVLPETPVDSRGEARLLTSPGALAVRETVDVEIRVAERASGAVTDGDGVLLYLDAGSRPGTIRVAGGPLSSGRAAIARIDCGTPVMCADGDRFLLRTSSAVPVMAGCTVVATGEASVGHSALSDPLGRRIDDWLQSVEAGATVAEAATALEVGEPAAAAVLTRMTEGGSALAIPCSRFIHAFCMRRLEERIVEIVQDYERANPLRPGMPKALLRERLGSDVDARLVGSLVRRLRRVGQLYAEEGVVWLPGRQADLGVRQQALLDRAIAMFRDARYAQLSIDDIAAGTGAPADVVQDFVRVAEGRGLLVELSGRLVLHAETIADARRVVSDLWHANGAFTVADFRRVTGCSRRVAVPLLEHLDEAGITVRVGDRRDLSERS